MGQADNANYKKIMNSLHKPDLTIWDENQPSRTVYGEFSVVFFSTGGFDYFSKTKVDRDERFLCVKKLYKAKIHQILKHVHVSRSNLTLASPEFFSRKDLR